MSRGKRTNMLGTANWYIREWMAHFGKIQADLEKELEWSKHRASKVYNLHQRYNEDLIEEIAAWLSVRPYELLQHPADVYANRRLIADAVRLATSSEATPKPGAPARTGTEG